MIFTSKYVMFARQKTDAVIDVIPLHEISYLGERTRAGTIEKENRNSSTDMNDDEEANDIDSIAGFTKLMFAINTVPDGYNSGRHYKIRATSSQNLRAIVRDLSFLCRAAADKAAAKSRLRKIQDKVSNLFNSSWTQRTLALVIFAVLPARPNAPLKIRHPFHSHTRMPV